MVAELIAIGISGSAGAISRYLLGLFIRQQVPSVFPLATLVVNVLGCFVMGILMNVVAAQGVYARQLLLIGAVGFLGSFTTFSAFGFETLELIRTQEIGFAALNLATNIILGIGAVWLGTLLWN